MQTSQVPNAQANQMSVEIYFGTRLCVLISRTYRLGTSKGQWSMTLDLWVANKWDSFSQPDLVEWVDLEARTGINGALWRTGGIGGWSSWTNTSRWALSDSSHQSHWLSGLSELWITVIHCFIHDKHWLLYIIFLHMQFSQQIGHSKWEIKTIICVFLQFKHFLQWYKVL